MKEPQLNPQVTDVAPSGPVLTAYDEEYMITYMRYLMLINKALTGVKSLGSCCASIQTLRPGREASRSFSRSRIGSHRPEAPAL